MEAPADPMVLQALGFRLRVVEIHHGQIDFVFMPIVAITEFQMVPQLPSVA